jgi:tetratricopeptide (TPR) repeat protein
MGQEEQYKKPAAIEGEVVSATQADEEEFDESDEFGEEAYDEDEEDFDAEFEDDDDEYDYDEEFDDDEELDEEYNEEEIDYQQQARNLADALNNSGLMAQVAAFMGGGTAIPGETAFMRGRGMQGMGDLEAAAEAYLDAIEQNPEHFRAYVALGQVLLAMDKPDDAIPFLEKAQDLNPDDAGSYLYLGYAYYARQEFDRCVEYFGRVTELEPTHHLAFNNLGYAQFLTGDLEGAARTFIRSGDIGSDRAYYNLGMVYLLQEKEEAAWQAYQDAADLDPHGSQIEDHLEDLESARLRYPQAVSKLDEVEQRLRDQAEELGVELPD